MANRSTYKPPPRRPAPPVWLPQATMFASITGKLTKAYLTADNIVRFTIEGWPIQGQFLGAVDPPIKESK